MGRVLKFGLGICLILFAIFMMVMVIKFGAFAAFFFIYPWVKDSLTEAGINPFVVKALAVCLSLALWAIIFGMIFKWRSNKQKFLGISKRAWGVCLLIAFFCGQAITMYYVTKDVNFASSGEALKWYTLHPITGQILIMDHPGIDERGEKAKPLTPEIAIAWEVQEKYPQAEISKEEIVNFFDRITGRPLAYYYQDDFGVCHYFVQSGYSPKTGKQFLPATIDALQKCDGSKDNFEKQKKAVEDGKKKIEDQKIELERQRGDLEDKSKKIVETRLALVKDEQVVKEDKVKLTREKEQLKQEKAVLEKQKKEQLGVISEGIQAVNGRVVIKGDRSLEIHLESNQPQSGAGQ